MRKRLAPVGMLILATIGLMVWMQQANGPALQTVHTIRVALWDYDAVDYDRKVIEQFETEHPDIQVEIISSPPAYYNDSLEAMLDSGERVDVIFVNQLSQLPALIADDIALPLDEWITRDKVALDEYPDISVLKDPDTGEVLALPYRKDKFVLYYNKDLFDAAGMAYPTHQMTWEAFRQTAAELTTRLKKLDQNNWGAYFLKKEMHLFYFLQSQPFQWDSDDFSLIRPGLSLLLAMQEDGSIPAFTRAAMAQDSQRLFEQGNYAMFVHGSWYMNFLAMDEEKGIVNFDWGVAERPVWSAGEPNQNDAWVTPVIIHRDTPEAEAAWAFVKYICGEKGAKILAGELILPALQSQQTDDILRTRLEERGILQEIFTNFSDPVAPPPYEKQALIDAVYNQYSRALLSLDTVDQSIHAMEEARQRILQQASP